MVWSEGDEEFFVDVFHFFDGATILVRRGRCCGGGMAGCKFGVHPVDNGLSRQYLRFCFHIGAA